MRHEVAVRATVTDAGIKIKSQTRGFCCPEVVHKPQGLYSILGGCFLSCCAPLGVNDAELSLDPDNSTFSMDEDIAEAPTVSDTIPFGRILGARYRDSSANSQTHETEGLLHGIGHQRYIDLTYACMKDHHVVPCTVPLQIDYVPMAHENPDLVELIIEKSYQNVKRNRSILVIINPHGGKGKAMHIFKKRIEPILIASECSFELMETKYSRHATDIAREIDLEEFDTIACASGDGVPYEVINGLYMREDKVDAFNKITVTQLPCGSGNAMSISCHWTDNPSFAALCLVKSVESRIDLMLCTQPDSEDPEPKLSFLSQTYGVIAESDINTEFIRWMGPLRFDIGVAFNVLQKKCYPCDIYVKYAAQSKRELSVHYTKNKTTQYLEFENLITETDTESSDSGIPVENITEENLRIKYPVEDGIPNDWVKLDDEIGNNLSVFYTGKMPYVAANTKFFPAALPADGTFDMIIMKANLPVAKSFPILLSIDKGEHVLDSEVIHSKVLAYKIIPKIENSLISIDGERFPCKPLQVEVLPKLCKTLLRNGKYIDTDFDMLCADTKLP